MARDMYLEGTVMTIKKQWMIVLITFYVMKKRPSHHDRTSDEVMESLNMRYIKGEIDEEEYLRRKQIIRQK